MISFQRVDKKPYCNVLYHNKLDSKMEPKYLFQLAWPCVSGFGKQVLHVADWVIISEPYAKRGRVWIISAKTYRVIRRVECPEPPNKRPEPIPGFGKHIVVHNHYLYLTDQLGFQGQGAVYRMHLPKKANDWIQPNRLELWWQNKKLNWCGGCGLRIKNGCIQIKCVCVESNEIQWRQVE